MRIVIAGSRSFNDWDKLNTELNQINDIFGIKLVISGTAEGADKLGEQWAEWNGIHIQRCPANWEKHGNAAGILRNIEMANIADLIVLFWDGKSKGTKQMLDYCLKHKKFVKVIMI